MAELRLVSVSEDGQHLLLADDAGAEHMIALDERLRAAVNGHLSRLGQLTMALESRISPREIQERVRGGESAEHVAVTAGVPLERVLRFVGPVLREREHVAEQAQRARLAGSVGLAGPAGPASLLADVVARAAARQGVDETDIVWDSARRDDHSWVVTVGWPDGTTATWALDPTRHQASPLDATARRVSGLGDEAPVVLPRAIDLDVELDLDPGSNLDAGPESGDNVRPFVPRAVSPSPEDVSAPEHDLTETAPITRPQTPVPPDPPARPSRRARVPKWDDIMFGPKSKD